ncbi:hypothetical protein K474DRAFT_1677553 [Panus rudis PR-1116 ss-1]|nr:hypothetical protein K474DRAFT_1677553 [Panus rudis PR-1116 ss-1]
MRSQFWLRSKQAPQGLRSRKARALHSLSSLSEEVIQRRWFFVLLLASCTLLPCQGRFLSKDEMDEVHYYALPWFMLVPAISLYALIIWISYQLRHLSLNPSLFTTGDQCLKKPISLFVVGGPIRKTAVLLLGVCVSPLDTVHDVFVALSHRRLVPTLKRVKYNLHFPSYSYAPLLPQERLANLGVQDMSTLYLSGCLLGGARQPENVSRIASDAFTFTNRTGHFPAKEPQFWKPLDGDEAGRFQCILCPLSAPVLPYVSRIRQHEGSIHHQRARKRWKRSSRRSNSIEGSHGVTPIRPTDVRGPLAEVLMQMKNCNSTATSHHEPSDLSGISVEHELPVSSEANIVNPVTSEQTAPAAPFNQPPPEDALAQQISTTLSEYLLSGARLSESEQQHVDDAKEQGQFRDEPHERPMDANISDSDTDEQDSSDELWYPWRNKETCILDILRHIPRCAFSERQNIVINWAMRALGLNDIPSEASMQKIDKALQRLCGVDSIRFEGALGHIYYTNDLAALIAQEMSNPLVRPYLNFLPEDAGRHLSEAWQGSRWLRELIPQLGTQMIRSQNQDFYVLEPALMYDHRVYIPLRWFKRRGRIYAKAYRLLPDREKQGWLVDRRHEYEIAERDLLLSFPQFRESHVRYNLPTPTNLLGVITSGSDEITPWTLTDPEKGNPWRERAKGHRVLAFPIWLYCDDTSGNVSKRWNKHNSFLFTAAGLPRRLVHKEYNIHFLSTSNIAAPVEMLDGIVQQLRECQQHGIWAWDSLQNEWALLIPSVLAILGDNPMQRLRGNFFCRSCWVSSSTVESEDGEVGDDNAQPGEDTQGEDTASDNASIYSNISESEATDSRSAGGQKQARRRRKPVETMKQMMDRLKRFMTTGRPRVRDETLRILQHQFESATKMGGQSDIQHNRTQTGIKDTYLNHFIDRLCHIASTRRGRTWAQRKAELAAAVANLPADKTALFSPVWRIKDLDPHKDTPVEILHVVLLGFVKYLWRDSVARIPDKDDSRKQLMARLSSCNVSGLKFPPLSGHTLVTYAKSLTGRDFRALVQVAPFVLYGLPGISSELLDAWIALGSLVRLVWQPEIHDLDQYLSDLQEGIDYFLNCVCKLTPRWFNKPKFHILLHLPEHIRRFGPAILFATEGFESFNAVIRAHSVHSNRQSPSRDIARSMARQNRTRHILSGGYFPINLPFSSRSIETNSSPANQSTSTPTITSTWIRMLLHEDLRHIRVRKAGRAVGSLITSGELCSDLLGLNIESFLDKTLKRNAGKCSDLKCRSAKWQDTEAGKAGLPFPGYASSALTDVPRGDDPILNTARKLTLVNGDICQIKDWVIFQDHNDTKVGRLVEILQLATKGSVNERDGKADWVLVQKSDVAGPHSVLKMPTLTVTNALSVVPVENLHCVVNVQHNCIARQCPVEETTTVVQEREKTAQRSLGVAHRFSSRSDSASRASETPKLDTDKVIFDAAKKEIDRAKQRRVGSETGNRNNTSTSTPSHSTAAESRSRMSLNPASQAPSQVALGQATPLFQEGSSRSHLPAGIQSRSLLSNLASGNSIQNDRSVEHHNAGPPLSRSSGSPGYTYGSTSSQGPFAQSSTADSSAYPQAVWKSAGMHYVPMSGTDSWALRDVLAQQRNNVS